MRTAFLRALLCAFLGAFRRAFVCAFAFRHPCPLAAPTARRSRDPAAALSARAPRRVISAVAAAALLAFSAGALAEPARGKTEEGVAYAMGGVSVEELTALERHKDRYSLWLTLAARGTGAYLADVEVRITATDGASPGRLVFNALVPGPWLMIDLPPGRYAVQAARRRPAPDVLLLRCAGGALARMAFAVPRQSVRQQVRAAAATRAGISRRHLAPASRTGISHRHLTPCHRP
ncbi:MAG: hypothetical protein MUC68_10440 [Burkholderiaceae bacterium]|nr:hypothetical protein [Burkholderiaceae bacterium]